MKLRRLYRHVRDEPGQAVVEMALVLPILMLILLGIFKFGVVYNNYLTLTDAVRSGARQYAVERGQATPCPDSAQALVNGVGTLDTSKVTGSMTENGTTWNFTVSGGVPVQSGSTGCPTLTSGEQATIKANYPCDLSLFGFTLPCSISSSVTERVE